MCNCSCCRLQHLGTVGVHSPDALLPPCAAAAEHNAAVVAAKQLTHNHCGLWRPGACVKAPGCYAMSVGVTLSLLLLLLLPLLPPLAGAAAYAAAGAAPASPPGTKGGSWLRSW